MLIQVMFLERSCQIQNALHVRQSLLKDRDSGSSQTLFPEANAINADNPLMAYGTD
jgi:hypothetical protein